MMLYYDVAPMGLAARKNPANLKILQILIQTMIYQRIIVTVQLLRRVRNAQH